MLFSQTIELPVNLILYAVAGLAFLVIGAAATYGLVHNRASYHHPVPHYQSSGGCGLIIALATLVILGVAAYVLLPKITVLYPHLTDENKVRVVQADVSPRPEPGATEPVNNTDQDLSIFGPVDTYEYTPPPANTINLRPELIQHAASSRQDWAESRAKKLRKQGYQNVTVEFNPDGGTHPWRILSQPVALP